MEDHVRNWTRFTARISLAETGDGKLGWAHSAMALFSVGAGELPR